MAKLVIYPPGQARLNAILADLTRDMTKGVARDAETNWMAHVETGKTLASVFPVWFNRRGPHGRIGQVVVRSAVWHFVEYGTSPHVIASKGGPLAYPLRNRAKDFYAYPGLVNHPGNREFAPMRNALYRKRTRRGYPVGNPLRVGK